MQKYWPLFIIPAFIWGSTWYVIKFQLGTVDPLVSVVYRYSLAGVIMLLFCLLTKAKLKFNKRDHIFMALQGLFLFGVNYWAVYEAEVYITSGMMAVAFSCIVFANSFFGRIFLKTPINPNIIFGAILALAGTALIFSAELMSFEFSSNVIFGMTIAMISVVLASLGQIVSARNSKEGIPVVQANTFGMLYGAVLMAILALVLDRPFTIDLSTSYLSSLLYLSLLGSVVAFATYLSLISKIGADKAAYSLVIIPVISIIISSILENYQMTIWAAIGIGLILIGNVTALKNKFSN